MLHSHVHTGCYGGGRLETGETLGEGARAADHFIWTRHPTASVPWTQASAAALDAHDLEQLAILIAAHAAEHRLADAPQLQAAWRRVRTGGAAYATIEADAVRAFLGPLNPAGDSEHLEAAVAEQLWHLLSVEDDDEPELVRIVGPKFLPTAPGYDGLTVRRDGTLVCTLWEIKKHAGGHLPGVIAGAYSQLAEHAPRYLAELSSTAQLCSDPDEARLFATLVTAWLAGEPHMRAGIAVAARSDLTRCFSNMKASFGHLTARDPCAGLLAVVSDIPAFARRVGEIAWTGL